MKPILTDLLAAMAQQYAAPSPGWQVDADRQEVRIEAPSGVWIFTSPLGRQTSRWLQRDARKLRYHKRYPAPIPFDDLVLLAALADIVAAATMVTEEDWRYVDELKAAVLTLRSILTP